MELVCPAANLPSLKAAVDNGADAVYLGFRNETNARHFAGLNFDSKQIQPALNYARSYGTKVYVAINTYAQPSNFAMWEEAVDQAAEFGVKCAVVPRVLSIKQVVNSPIPVAPVRRRASYAGPKWTPGSRRT